MEIEIKSFKEMWIINIIIKKSGNKYGYNSLLYKKPSELQVKELWSTQRKFWNRLA